LTPDDEDAILLAESYGFDLSFLKSSTKLKKKKYKVPSKIELKKEATIMAAI